MLETEAERIAAARTALRKILMTADCGPHRDVAAANQDLDAIRKTAQKCLEAIGYQ